MGTKGDSNRQQIVDAADQLFYIRGYSQTSFSDISELTGIPRGNFYYYFKTKEDILYAVVDGRVKSYNDALKYCDVTTTNPKERLMTFIDILEKSQEGVVRSGCPIGTLSTELAKGSNHLSNKSREIFEVLREWLRKQFSLLGFENATDKAMDLLARLQGITVIACAFQDKDFLQRSVKDIRLWMKSALVAH